MNVKLAALLSVVIALSACAPAASLGGDVGLARADVARASADPGDAIRAGAAVDAFGLDLYRAIAAGQSHAAALNADGTVSTWGNDDNGQLGNDSTTNSLEPVPVIEMTSGVQAIVAGYRHACALVAGGVQCWGNNNSGQLGDDSSATSDVPVSVTGLTSGVQAIVAGSGAEYTCALTNGEVLCWGDNTYGELGNNSTSGTAVPVAVQPWAP